MTTIQIFSGVLILCVIFIIILVVINATLKSELKQFGERLSSLEDKLHSVRLHSTNRLYEKDIPDFADWQIKNNWHPENGVWTNGSKKLTSDKLRDEYTEQTA